MWGFKIEIKVDGNAVNKESALDVKMAALVNSGLDIESKMVEKESCNKIENDNKYSEDKNGNKINSMG